MMLMKAGSRFIKTPKLSTAMSAAILALIAPCLLPRASACTAPLYAEAGDRGSREASAGAPAQALGKTMGCRMNESRRLDLRKLTDDT